MINLQLTLTDILIICLGLVLFIVTVIITTLRVERHLERIDMSLYHVLSKTRDLEVILAKIVPVKKRTDITVEGLYAENKNKDDQ